MSYADKRQLVTFNVNTADSAALIADNTDVFNVVIPAGREIEIQSLNAAVRGASASGDFIELVDDSDNVLAKVSIASTGFKSAVASDGTTASTFPIRLAPQSATALSSLKLRTDGATDTSTDVTVQLEITGL